MACIQDKKREENFLKIRTDVLCCSTVCGSELEKMGMPGAFNLKWVMGASLAAITF